MLFGTLRLTVKCLKCAPTLQSLKSGTLMRAQPFTHKVHRRPVRIVNEEEILEKIEEAEGPNEFLDEKRKPLKVRPKKAKPKQKVVVTEADTRLKEDGRLNFSELKENDPFLMNLMMSVRSRKIRDKNSRIILEGHRLITDALEAGSIPEVVVFSRVSDALKLPLPEEGIKLYKTPYRAIQTWTTLTTAPGLMGFFKTPDIENMAPAPDALPLTIICDNVREPGNLGAILRACAGVGCKQLILMKGCVDLWDSKVLRSAAGAHFRMPVFASRTWEDVRRMIHPSACIWVADNETTPSEEASAESDEDFQLLVEKPDDFSTSESDFPESSESSESPESSVDLGTPEEKFFDSIANQSEMKSYRQRQNDAKLARKLVTRVPIIPYYATNFNTECENVIIVGGETEGVSLEALAVVHERSGVRLNIPMTNGVESLNTGMALGIIAFELRRQFSVAGRDYGDSRSSE